MEEELNAGPSREQAINSALDERRSSMPAEKSFITAPFDEENNDQVDVYTGKSGRKLAHLKAMLS